MKGLPEAGGVDMPQKTNPYEMQTPSGQFPIFIPMSLWKAMPGGWDNRWYAVARPIPEIKTKKTRRTR